jgi:hypothetical protein
MVITAPNFEIYANIARAFGLDVRNAPLASDYTGTYAMVECRETGRFRVAYGLDSRSFGFGNQLFFVEWVLKYVEAVAKNGYRDQH